MAIEKQKKTDGGIVFQDSFSEKEVRDLMGELIPEDERGRNLTPRFNGTIEGNVWTNEYTYENVFVIVYGIRGPDEVAGGKVITITWPKRPCGEVQR
jgi:hypothetical protein